MNFTEQDIIDFWFSDAVKPLWFNSTPEFDQSLKARYLPVYDLAAADSLSYWQDSPEGCLSLAIILDQFPLNMFRGEPKSFATEAKAVQIARMAIDKQFDVKIEPDKRVFLYMPFMHSESINDQDQSVTLFKTAGLIENVKFAEHHRDIIRQFGRFPHRNAILGRDSTEAEVEYLQSDKAFHG